MQNRNIRLMLHVNFAELAMVLWPRKSLNPRSGSFLFLRREVVLELLVVQARTDLCFTLPLSPPPITGQGKVYKPLTPQDVTQRWYVTLSPHWCVNPLQLMLLWLNICGWRESLLCAPLNLMTSTTDSLTKVKRFHFHSWDSPWIEPPMLMCFQISEWNGPVSKQWQIVSFTSELHSNKYEGNDFDTIFFTLHLKRKSLFYIINLMVCCLHDFFVHPLWSEKASIPALVNTCHK